MTASNEKNPLRADDEHIVIDAAERALGGGRWITGRLHDHSFCAKVYATHAIDPSFELGTSRISKLEVRHLPDEAVVANFDRGWDIRPRTKAAEHVVETLTASLANRVFPDFNGAPSESEPPDKRRVTQVECPFCSDPMTSIDTHDGTVFQSQTVKCDACQECFLHVRRENDAAIIHLPEFLERRGDAPEQRPLNDRTMATKVVSAVVCDEWPSRAACVDFGLSTARHYAAMQQALKEGLTAYEMDRVLGDGRAITEVISFCRRDMQINSVTFSTPYDEMQREPSDNQRGVQQKRKTKFTLEF